MLVNSLTKNDGIISEVYCIDILFNTFIYIIIINYYSYYIHDISKLHNSDLRGH